MSSSGDSGANRSRSILRAYLELTLAAFVILNFIRIFVVQAYKIPSGSMSSALTVGDHILVNKFVITPGGTLLPTKAIARGDVVVFRSPEKPALKYVKRVIGMPGETILVHDKAVFVNGRRLREPYVSHVDPTTFPAMRELPEPQRSRDQFGPMRVPDDAYFVLGDNRDRSYDSRYWGAVPRRLITGRAFLIYWSFDGGKGGERVSERLGELYAVVRHFFSRTRWERSLMPIAGYDYGDAAAIQEGREANR